MNTIITESTNYGEVPVNIYQKLSNNRILFISNEITDNLATDIVANLILRDAENQDEKITLFINSSGGDIRNVLMIYDMMNIVKCPIETVCIGSALDEAVLLLAAGTKGMRLATKNSVIAVSQLISEFVNMSDLTDAKKALQQNIEDNKKMVEALAKTTDKTTKQIMSDFDRRVFMNSTNAVKYGLIDKVINFNKDK